jgi:pimeloyl-ACP methyl ester carboxylesterase
MTEIKTDSHRVNGIELAYLESGSGPLVVLLHGFPDNAWSWEYQLRALAGAG